MLSFLRRNRSTEKADRQEPIPPGMSGFAEAQLSRLREQDTQERPAWVWRDPKPHVLFLAVDGVLHAGSSGSFDKVPQLEQLLRMFPDIDLVITSGPRDDAENRIVKGRFSDDVAPRICGTTEPTFAGASPILGKHMEILRFAKRSGVRFFASLDVPSAGYPSEASYLVITDPAEGITYRTTELLGRTFLKWFPRTKIDWPDGSEGPV